MISSAYKSVQNYIDKLWQEMSLRYAYTDLSASDTSFSEAPAEGIFSVIEQIVQGRESLSIENLNALARIRLEGPRVSTLEAYELSKETLQLWNSHQGERFTTKAWMPGLKNKAMMAIQGNVHK